MADLNNPDELNAKIDELVRAIAALNESVRKSASASEDAAKASTDAAKATEKATKTANKTKRTVDRPKETVSKSLADDLVKQFEKAAAVYGAKQARSASNEARKASAAAGQPKSVQYAKALDAFNLSLGKSAAVLNQLSVSATAVGKSFSALGKSLAAGNANSAGYANAVKSVGNAVADTAAILSSNPYVKGLALAVKAVLAVTGPIAKLADSQFEIYKQMADVGANTAQELAGVNTLLDDFGLGVENASKMLGVLAAHAEGLSMAGGTVAKGAQRLGGVIKNLRDSGLQAELLNLGISYEAQRESAAAYMDTMGRTGIAQKKSVNEMTESIAKYLVEQDALTRLTGATRKEQEAARNRALAEEQFRNRINRLIDEGKEEQAERELRAYQEVSAISGPEMASQLFAGLDGFITKGNEGLSVLLGTQNQEIARLLADNTISASEAAARVNQLARQALGQGGVGSTMAMTGQFRERFGMSIEGVSNPAYGRQNVTGELDEIRRQQEITRGRPSAAVEGQVRIAEANIKVQRSLENLLTLGVEPLTIAMGKLAQLTGRIADAINVGPGTLKGEGRASGGIIRGPVSGYPATLHGTEAVIPLGHGSIPLKITGGPDVQSGPAFSPAAELAHQLEKNNQALDVANITLEQILASINEEVSIISGSRAGGTPAAPAAMPMGASGTTGSNIQVSGELGTMSAKYESGSAGSMAVGRDRSGGTSYGKYQIASKVGSMDAFLKLLEKNDPEAHARLMGAGPQDAGVQGQFAQEWKKLVGEGRIQKSEREFAVEKIFKPAMSGLKDQDLSKMISENKGLQEMMFSMAIQHGPGGAPAILNKVYKKGMSSEELTKAAYAERGADQGMRYFSKSTEAERAGVVSRFGREEKDVLALLGQPGLTAPGTAPTAVAAAPAGLSKATAAVSTTAAGPAAAGGATFDPLTSLAQSVMGFLGLGATPTAGAQPGLQPSVAGITAGGTPGAISGDIGSMTQAMQAQTAATQTAITSGMENLTNQLVSKIGGGGVGDPAVPSLLGEILSASREQTSAINRLIQVSTS